MEKLFNLFFKYRKFYSSIQVKKILGLNKLTTIVLIVIVLLL